MTALTVHVVRTDEDLAALAPEWRELLASSSVATPFQTPEMLLAYRGVFRPGPLACIAVREGRHLVAFAPLYVETGANGARLVPLGLGPADYLDILISPDRRGPALDCLSAALRDLGPRWEFDDLAEHAELHHLPAPHGWRDETVPWRICPVLNLADNDPETLSAVPPRRRRKWRMAKHRAAGAGGATVRPVGADDLPSALACLARWSRIRHAETDDPSSFEDPQMLAFLERAATGLARAGDLVAYQLEIAGEPAGLFLGFANARSVHAYACAFDPRFAALSPGTLLVGHAVAEATRAGRTSFHFLRGDEAYKRTWGAADRRTFRRIVAPPEKDAR